MNRSPGRINHRREILQWLVSGDQSYGELLARYQRALPAHDVDTREAFAVLVGAMVGEGLLQRCASNGTAPADDGQTQVIGRLWLTEKGRRTLEDEQPAP